MNFEGGSNKVVPKIHYLHLSLPKFTVLPTKFTVSTWASIKIHCLDLNISTPTSIKVTISTRASTKFIVQVVRGREHQLDLFSDLYPVQVECLAPILEMKSLWIILLSSILEMIILSYKDRCQTLHLNSGINTIHTLAPILEMKGLWIILSYIVFIPLFRCPSRRQPWAESWHWFWAGDLHPSPRPRGEVRERLQQRQQALPLSQSIELHLPCQ